MLRAGVAVTGPHPSLMHAKMRKVEQMIQVLQQAASGEVSAAKAVDTFIAEGYMAQPPEWLPSDIAFQLIHEVAKAQKTQGNPLGQLVKWLKKETAKPPGRATSQSLQRVHQAAARFRAQGLSWGKITRRVCPQREDASHRCSRACEDRIRQGASRYLRSTRENTAT